MATSRRTTEVTLGQVAREGAPAERAKVDDKLKYAVVPIEWLRAVQPIDLQDRPSVRAIPMDMLAALEELVAAAKSTKALSFDQELALRAAAWSAPAGL